MPEVGPTLPDPALWRTVAQLAHELIAVRGLRPDLADVQTSRSMNSLSGPQAVHFWCIRSFRSTVFVSRLRPRFLRPAYCGAGQRFPVGQTCRAPGADLA